MTEDHVKARNTDYCGYAIADGGVISTKAHSLLKHTVTEAASDTDQKTQAGEYKPGSSGDKYCWLQCLHNSTVESSSQGKRNPRIFLK